MELHTQQGSTCFVYVVFAQHQLSLCCLRLFLHDNWTSPGQNNNVILVEHNYKVLMRKFLFSLFIGQDQINVHKLSLQMGTDDWRSEELWITHIFSLFWLQVGTEEIEGCADWQAVHSSLHKEVMAISGTHFLKLGRTESFQFIEIYMTIFVRHQFIPTNLCFFFISVSGSH